MVRLKTFNGGVHPPGSKYLTEGKQIEDVPLPSRVVIPLHQHTGAPCEPLVKVGDGVSEGQKVGDADAFVSAPVHASIAGKVVAIEPHPHPAISKSVMAVVIEKSEGSSGQDAHPPGYPNTGRQAGNSEKVNWQGMAPDEIKKKIREAGIVGLGGAAFPTHVKLSPPQDKKIDTVILNGVECEPYLTADHRLMLEKPAEIIEGLDIILKVLGVKRAFIAIEANKPDAIEKMGSLIKNEAVIEVAPLKVKYPQGAEKQLIKAILNREVPSGGLPFDVGVIVQNVGTAYAVYEAVTAGRPLIERVVTVTGDGIKKPGNLRVRIGTPFSQVIEHCGGLTNGVSRVIMGGPMMGLAQYTLDVPVVKGTSGILILRGGPEEEGPCIRCGKCVDTCPMYLLPYQIGNYAEKDMFEQCKEYDVLDCMECGACAYICPARRPLIHLIKYAKSRLAAQKTEKAKK